MAQLNHECFQCQQYLELLNNNNLLLLDKENSMLHYQDLLQYYQESLQNTQELLQQNQSLAIDGNAGEIINKQFLATFSGAGTNNLVTIKKNYL